MILTSTIMSVFTSAWKLVLIFLASISFTYIMFQQLLAREPQLALALNWKLSFEDMQRSDVNLAFRRAMEDEFYLSLACFACVYFIKQTFAIPGSALLNILAGVLLPIHIAFPVVSALTMIGASCCYLLSSTLGSRERLVALTDYLLPGKLEVLQNKITQAHEDNRLFFVLLFLRIFPFSPNWLLNIASPYLRIPIYLFAPAVLLGLMPYNFVTVKAGSMLAQLNSVQDIFDTQTLLGFLFLAIAMLIPAIVKKRANQKSD
ncbi:SNARE associated Golgi protein [Thraustotheca clavata]|uniref:SNARE associated Golgi protein n=1 Tax=Thraustotheca clavata TaxID=74557 RepID=A0A1W0ADB2_9STRA|nr:SNARE associated Golgi protein [Thraustotheca clavata]